MNVPQPIFGTEGTVTKMSNLGLQCLHSLLGIPRPLFSCPYLECQLVREIHRPRAFVFGAISSSPQQSNDVTPSFIDPRSGGLVSLVTAEWSNPIPRSDSWTLMTHPHYANADNATDGIIKAMLDNI